MLIFIIIRISSSYSSEVTRKSSRLLQIKALRVEISCVRLSCVANLKEIVKQGEFSLLFLHLPCRLVHEHEQCVVAKVL